jgi:hypothetical protein
MRVDERAAFTAEMLRIRHLYTLIQISFLGIAKEPLMKCFKFWVGGIPAVVPLAYWRACCVVLIALAASSVTTTSAQAYFIVAGELIVDLQASDLNSALTTWVNRDTAGATVGNFTTIGGATLNVAENVTDGVITVPKALNVNLVGNNALRSALAAPATLLGNDSRSIEAWVLSNGTAGTQAVVSWGTNGGNQFLSSHNYSGGGNGLHSGWFNDTGWTGAGSVPGAVVPATSVWHHLTWTWDGQNVRGYTDGVLTKTFDLADFATASSLMTIGSTRNGATDPFNGYIADVRVHSGVLLPEQILNNFQEGIGPSDGSACDFNNSGACDSVDFGILRDNLFKAGTFAQGDIDKDGIVGISDYHQFKSDPTRLISGSGAMAFGQVPEPTSLTCLGIAIALLATSARRRG